MKNKRILAVGTHPDDVEFMCSGTLKLLKQKGHKIFIVIIANGDCGSMVPSQENITQVRREEAIEAAKLLDAEIYFLNEYDLKIELNNKTMMKVTEYIRIVDPFTVFTHPHEDYTMDHEITSRLVRMACFNSPLPHYTTDFKSPRSHTSTIPYLYYWSPIKGINIYGDFVDQRIYVNITEVIDFKAEMLACHKSQRDLLEKFQGMDNYIEIMINTAKLYGEKSDFSYAEGFSQHLGNAYPQDNILKEILGDVVMEKEQTATRMH